MYYFFVVLQCIGIAIGLFEIVFILKQPQSKCQTLLLCLMFAVLINSLGYFFELTSDSWELSLQAIKFTYFGKAFAPLLFMLFILEYCRIRLPQVVICVLAGVHCFILGLVETCENNELYYSSISFTEDGLFPHLVLGHGIVYYCYTGLLLCYLLAVPVYCMIKTKRKLDKNEHHLLLHLADIVVIMTAGLALFLSGVTRGYDSTAIAYVISETIMLRMLVKENILGTLAAAKDYVADNISQGLIIAGSDGSLLYFNEAAARIYPVLRTQEAAAVVKTVSEAAACDKIHFDTGNVYKTTVQRMMRGNSELCSIYMLEDITKEYHYADRLKADVALKTDEIKKMQRSVIGSFAGMVEARDGDTGQHVKRTVEYVSIITRALRAKPNYAAQLDDDTVDMIAAAAPLHDIGKISVPDAILTKPAKLTEDEFTVIKTHAATGAEIIHDTLSEVENGGYLRIAMDMARHHHEKWDGTGYPDGLAGQSIPLPARIMAVADVYDALRTKRSYKDAFTAEEAYGIITGDSGTHFDPEIVEVFMERRTDIEAVSEM